MGVAPMLLLGFDMVQSQSERVWGTSSFAFGALIIVSGALLFFLSYVLRPKIFRISGVVKRTS